MRTGSFRGVFSVDCCRVRRSQFFQKLGGGVVGACGVGLLGWGANRLINKDKA